MIYSATDIFRLQARVAALGGNSGYVLGFNEPDILNQANLSPADAAKYWRQLEALYPGKRLVSPAISHRGLDWLPQFYNAYVARYDRPPRLDGGLAVHCYLNSAARCKAVIEHVIGYAKQWNSPGVWVTEFMFWPYETGEAEAREFIAWMESEPMVLRYAWFPTRLECGKWAWDTDCLFADNALVTDGGLTEWGRFYAGIGND